MAPLSIQECLWRPSESIVSMWAGTGRLLSVAGGGAAVSVYF